MSAERFFGSPISDLFTYRASAGANGPDGTVTYVDRQTLQVVCQINGTINFTPKDHEILRVIEMPAGSQNVILWGGTALHPMTYDPGTQNLTVQNANFQAGSDFIVVYTDLSRKSASVFWLIYNAIVAGTTHLDRIIAVNDQVPPDVYGAEIMGRAYDTGSLPTVTDGTMTWLSLTRQGLARVYDSILDSVRDTHDAVPTTAFGLKTLSEVSSGIVTAITAGRLARTTMTLDRATRVQDMRMLLAFLGTNSAYHSPDHFTATRTAATILTLTGLSFTPVSRQFMGVIEYKVDGTSVFHTIRDGFTFIFASTGVGTGTLTVTGTGVNFEATSTFTVVILGQQRAFDGVLNAIQMAQLNARQQDLVTQQTLFTAQALDNEAANIKSAWIGVEGQTEIGLFAAWLPDADAGNVELFCRILANDTDAGTDEYVAMTGTLDAANSEIDTYDAPIHYVVAAPDGGTTYRPWWRVKISTATRVKAHVWEINASGYGVLDMTCKLINR